MHDYYKYQNVKTVDEYKRLLKDKRSSVEPNKVIEIPIFRNCEFDIERLIENYEMIIGCIYEREQELMVESASLKSSLGYFLNVSHASYLAPAYNYNRYINLLIDSNIKRMNKELENSFQVNYYYTILIENVLISIKALLDRMVPVISFYESGISLSTTFGHVDLNTLKSKGFMSHVVRHKDSNDLMKFIYDEYVNWIKKVVEPRNTIIHYNDLKSETRYTADGREFPMHYNVKVFSDISDEREFEWEDGFYYKSLMKNVQDVYYFFDAIMHYLKNHDLKYQREHFISFEEYERYKKMREE